VVCAGDEVIIFDPSYDSYVPAIELNGGQPKHIPLFPPNFEIDWDRVKAACSSKTKLIILNTPHNPSGTVLRENDIKQLQNLVQRTNILILSDEVYEHILFDGQQHNSLNRWQDLAERSFIVSSFGKTYHVTGWKLGYCVAPPALTTELRKVHQYVTFCSPNPLQQAVADFMMTEPLFDETLADFYQAKRDLMNAALANSPFGVLPSVGTYFQLINYREFSQLDDLAFAKWLTENAGVAAIPLSPFYADQAQTGHVRLCFAKTDSVLQRATDRLHSQQLQAQITP
jgi:methionine aminotransferase